MSELIQSYGGSKQTDFTHSFILNLFVKLFFYAELACTTFSVPRYRALCDCASICTVFLVLSIDSICATVQMQHMFGHVSLACWRYGAKIGEQIIQCFYTPSLHHLYHPLKYWGFLFSRIFPFLAAPFIVQLS